MKQTALLTTFTYARNRQSSANRLVVSFIYSKLYKFNPIFFYRILLLFSSFFFDDSGCTATEQPNRPINNRFK